MKYIHIYITNEPDLSRSLKSWVSTYQPLTVELIPDVFVTILLKDTSIRVHTANISPIRHLQYKASHLRHGTYTPYLSSWSEPTSPHTRPGKWTRITNKARKQIFHILCLVAAEIPQYLCRYMLRFEEEPTCLEISEKPRVHWIHKPTATKPHQTTRQCEEEYNKQ